MPFEMLFDKDHKVLLVRFGARPDPPSVLVSPSDEMFGAARLYGLHRQGEEPMVVRDCRRPTTFWA